MKVILIFTLISCAFHANAFNSNCRLSIGQKSFNVFNKVVLDELLTRKGYKVFENADLHFGERLHVESDGSGIGRSIYSQSIFLKGILSTGAKIAIEKSVDYRNPLDLESKVNRKLKKLLESLPHCSEL